ncbi:hypothetical protein PENTCL1PPCAC_29168, partial [Pristionchus entomophagus]
GRHPALDRHPHILLGRHEDGEHCDDGGGIIVVELVDDVIVHVELDVLHGTREIVEQHHHWGSVGGEERRRGGRKEEEGEGTHSRVGSREAREMSHCSIRLRNLMGART